MKQLIVRISDCSGEELIRVAEKSGFVVDGGTKHSKVKTVNGETVALIPRHNRIKRELARAIVKDMVEFGASIEIR